MPVSPKKLHNPFLLFGISGVPSVVGNKKTFFLNFSKIFGKIVLFGVVGIEKISEGLGYFPTSNFQPTRRSARGRKYGKGYSFPMLATKLFFIRLRKDGKGMERKQEIENRGFMPKKGNPLHETVTYKIGGTYFEVTTSCGGSERLYHKMKRLIKSESVKTPTDKKENVRYNKGSNLSVGRSLQEE